MSRRTDARLIADCGQCWAAVKERDVLVVGRRGLQWSFKTKRCPRRAATPDGRFCYMHGDFAARGEQAVWEDKT